MILPRPRATGHKGTRATIRRSFSAFIKRMNGPRRRTFYLLYGVPPVFRIIRTTGGRRIEGTFRRRRRALRGGSFVARWRADDVKSISRGTRLHGRRDKPCTRWVARRDTGFRYFHVGTRGYSEVWKEFEYIPRYAESTWGTTKWRRLGDRFNVEY